jgi:hypothetical protein
MTPRRMKVATASIFVAATVGSTVALKGSTPPDHPTTPAAPAKSAPHNSATPIDGPRQKQ